MLYLFTVDSRTATSGVVQIDITSASNPTFVKFTPTGGTGDVNFDLASSDLTPAAIKILKKVIAVIKARGYTSVALNGHTDSNGAGVYDNKTLSLDRDNTVMGYLIAHLPNVQLTFTKKWFADKLPTASNDTEAGQAKNRRVEISAK